MLSMCTNNNRDNTVAADTLGQPLMCMCDTAMREKKQESVLLSTSDFSQLKFFWKSEWYPSRSLEVIVNAFHWRVPQLNGYLHRCRLAQTAQCSYCNEDESVDPYLLSCQRFTRLRNQLLEVPLASLGIAMSVPAIL